MMGKENPVGQIIRQDSVAYQVVGVMQNFVYGDMYGKTDPLIFFCRPSYANIMYIRLNEGKDIEKSVAQIGNVLKADNPGFPFDYRFVNDQFNELFKSEMLIGVLSRVFAFLRYFHFMFRLIWTCCIYCRKENKRNWYQKSIRSNGCRVLQRCFPLIF